MEELIRSINKFGGTLNEDVIKWLHDMEAIFDQVQLRPSNKYIVAQSYLTKTAATWFRFNKSNILDWPTFQIEIAKAFQLSTSSKISSNSAISQKEKENENNQVDLINNNQVDLIHDNQVDLTTDNEIKSFEDLENKGLHEYEQGRYLSTLININDIDLKIQQQSPDEPVDCNQLSHETIINSDPIEAGVEDTFEGFTETMNSLTADDSLINTVLPQDVQYLWSDKYKPRQPRILNKTHTVYNWNHYNKQHYNKDNPPSTTIQALSVCGDHQDLSILQFQVGPLHEDIAFNIVSKEWNYSYHYGFRYYSHNGIFQLRFSFRKWKYRRSTLFSFREWKYRKWKHRKWRCRAWKYR